MKKAAYPYGQLLLTALMVMGVQACKVHRPAPIVERSNNPIVQTPRSQYTVVAGDSLYAIAFRFGLDHRELAAWNNIRAPYVIHPEQSLSLRPPDRTARSATAATVTARPASPPPTTVDRPAVDRTEGEASPRVVTPPVKAAPPPAASVKPPAVPPPSTSPASEPEDWLWPTKGRVLSRFVAGDPARTGLDIAGNPGQPVMAAAAGTVVYSGSGLIGYGELIIIKHNDRLLSAYAHNQRRLVNEGEQVARGKAIAELGRNDRQQSVLHFEIRVNGRPVDPMKYLPSTR